MVQHKQAFTLIELLVVVLIIGILAAVALPQYQIAVEKSRAREALVNVRALSDAENIYRLANGQETEDFKKLDIEITGNINENVITTDTFSYSLSNMNVNTGRTEIVAERIDNNIDRQKYYIYRNFGGQVACVAKTEHAKQICSNVSGTNSFSSHSGGHYYIFPNVRF